MILLGLGDSSWLWEQAKRRKEARNLCSEPKYAVLPSRIDGWVSIAASSVSSTQGLSCLCFPGKLPFPPKLD